MSNGIKLREGTVPGAFNYRPLTYFVFSPDGLYIVATLDYNNEMAVSIRVSDLTEHFTWTAQVIDLLQADFSPDGQLLALAGRNQDQPCKSFLLSLYFSIG